METDSDLALMLRDLANLLPNMEALRRLHKVWPNLLPESPTYFAQFAELELRTPSGEVLAREEAGLHYALWMQELVRQLWSGTTAHRAEIEAILLTGQLGESVDSPLSFLNARPTPGIFGIDWKRRRFEYRPQTLLQQALYFLLQNVRRAKICANPDCPAPYFIGPRGSTQLCSKACSEEVKKEAKRAWWRENGPRWRQERKKKNRTTASIKKSLK